MRILTVCVLLFVLAALVGCASSNQGEKSVSQQQSATRQTGTSTTEVAQKGAADTASTAPAPNSSTIQDGAMKPASLQNAENSRASVTVTERKLIRNAEILLESSNPPDAQRRVSSIAEAHGGFVVTAESKQVNEGGRAKPETSATVIIRVPSAQFDSVINEIYGSSGARKVQDKVTTQDVTEEYIDLEARIRAKQALEAQFMEIMKRANTVAEALEVQRQLSDVRSEIERLEGRRRFLENQSSLSTITINILPPSQVVSSTGFFYSVKRAFGDGLDVASTITLGLISILIALLPLLVFIVLPVVLFVRYMIRRSQRRPIVVETAPQPPPTVTTT